MATHAPINNGSTYIPTAGEGSVPQWHGTYSATVVNNNDPLGVGRLQLHVPQVLGNAVSAWAVPAGLYYKIPSNNATVSVTFVGGDPAQPAWNGALDLAPSVNSGAVAVTYSVSEPPNPKVGDIWYPITTAVGGESVGQPQVWQFDSGTSEFNWVPQPGVGTSGIAPSSITEALLGSDVTGTINSKSTTVAHLDTTMPTAATAGDIWMQVNSNGIVTSIMLCTTTYASGAGSLADWTNETSMNARAIGAPFVYQQSLTPNTANNGSNPPQLNDLWINTGAGNAITQMTGGTAPSPTWTTFQMGASAIQNGAINAGHIATGTIVAGIINGTTVTGATFLGTNWIENTHGMFMYSGTPASGNLLLSIAATSGTDQFGNAYDSGFAIYGTDGNTVHIYTSGSAAVVDYPSGAASENIQAKTSTTIFNQGSSNEAIEFRLAGPQSTFDDTGVNIILNSSAANGSTVYTGTLEAGPSASATWGTSSSGSTYVAIPHQLLVGGATGTASIATAGDVHIGGNLVMGNMNGSASLPLGTISTVSGSSTTTQLASAINGLISRLQSIGVIS